jgi:hypothetical protein
MCASRHIASDRDIIRLIGQNEPGRRFPIHQASQDRRVGSVAAQNAMLTEAKYIAEARERDSVGLGSKRTLFNLFYVIAKDDLVDLLECEAGDLDRRLGEDEFLEFDFELA